jgi:lipoate-protein ligase A
VSVVPEAHGTGTVLRVIDFGRVSPLRSQTLWHSIGYGVSAGGPVTLSFARPAAPYACLGYLRHTAEIDHDYCRAHGLPLYRRMIGGGPVYLDQRQLFFQICVPAGSVSPSRAVALRSLLEPAVAAFRAVGVAASLDDDGEICVGDRKICGHGAGQIEDAVVACGNLIEAFDHERATGVLALPDPEQRAETLRLMRRYVAATAADPGAFQAALTTACAGALGLRAVPGSLSEAERQAVARLDRRFASARWLAGPTRMSGPGGHGRPVKVRAGIWTYAAEAGGVRIVASVVKGRLDRVWLTAPAMNGTARAAEEALAGTPVSTAGAVLGRLGFGQSGRELAAALARAEGRLR